VKFGESCHWRRGRSCTPKDGRRAGGVSVDDSGDDRVTGGRTSAHTDAVDERVTDHLKVRQQRHVEDEHERRGGRHAFVGHVRVERDEEVDGVW